MCVCVCVCVCVLCVRVCVRACVCVRVCLCRLFRHHEQATRAAVSNVIIDAAKEEEQARPGTAQPWTCGHECAPASASTSSTPSRRERRQLLQKYVTGSEHAQPSDEITGSLHVLEQSLHPMSGSCCARPLAPPATSERPRANGAHCHAMRSMSICDGRTKSSKGWKSAEKKDEARVSVFCRLIATCFTCQMITCSCIPRHDGRETAEACILDRIILNPRARMTCLVKTLASDRAPRTSASCPPDGLSCILCKICTLLIHLHSQLRIQG